MGKSLPNLLDTYHLLTAIRIPSQRIFNLDFHPFFYCVHVKFKSIEMFFVIYLANV